MEDCGNSDSTHRSGQGSDRTLSLTPPSLYPIGKGEYKVSVTKKNLEKVFKSSFWQFVVWWIKVRQISVSGTQIILLKQFRAANRNQWFGADLMSLEVGAMLVPIDGSLSASDTSVWPFATCITLASTLNGKHITQISILIPLIHENNREYHRRSPTSRVHQYNCSLRTSFQSFSFFLVHSIITFTAWSRSFFLYSSC